jgi:hypothetical protein
MFSSLSRWNWQERTRGAAILLLKSFHAPSTAARAAAYGTHSLFMIVVPNTMRNAGIYTPLIFSFEVHELVRAKGVGKPICIE